MRRNHCFEGKTLTEGRVGSFSISHFPFDIDLSNFTHAELLGNEKWKMKNEK
jgi:hypothetical protein